MEEIRRGLPRTALFAGLSGAIGGLALGALGFLCLLLARITIGDISLVLAITAACSAVACALLAAAEAVAVRFRVALRPLAVVAVGCGASLAMTIATAIAFGLFMGSGPGGAIVALFDLLGEALRDPDGALALTISALLPFGAVGAARTVARPLAEGRRARWPHLIAVALLPLSGALAYATLIAGLGSPSPREVRLIVPFCLGAPVIAALALSAASRLERLIVHRAERHAGG